MPQVFRNLCFVVALASSVTLAQSALAQQKIVKWAIQATVIEINDPNGLFPDVRLGDPVHGWMSYDRGTDPDPDLSEEHIDIYQSALGFQGVSMIIENPRSGGAVKFAPDMRPWSGTIVNIANDFVDPNDGVVDWVWVDLGVVPPTESVSHFADLAVFLYGPGTTLSDSSLPTDLNLNDWPHAIIEFRDNFLHQDATEIFAEIYSLTPVPVVLGDYDSDGIVDSKDYDLWRRGVAPDDTRPGVRNGDGNGDGAVDAADYVSWRNAVAGALGSGSPANDTAPEPTTAVLVMLGATGICVTRRRTWLFSKRLGK